MSLSPNHLKKTLLCCFFTLTVLFAFNSCKKKESFETVYPKSYYPAYPGSSWNYIDSNGDESTVSVNANYQLHSYLVGNSSETMSEEKYVPLVSNKGYIYGYSQPRDGILRPFLSEQLDETLIYSEYTPSIPFGVYFIEHISNVDTTIVINGVSYYPTIEVKSYVDDYLRKILYYTKDVGLVKELRCISGDCDSTTITEISLVNYFINN